MDEDASSIVVVNLALRCSRTQSSMYSIIQPRSKCFDDVIPLLCILKHSVYRQVFFVHTFMIASLRQFLDSADEE